MWIFSAKPTTSCASLFCKNFTQNVSAKIVYNDEKTPPPAYRWRRMDYFLRVRRSMRPTSAWAAVPVKAPVRMPLTVRTGR